MNANANSGLGSLPHGYLLTGEKFSALDYINATFETTSSLEAGLEDFSAKIESQLIDLDTSISNAIQSQSQTHSAATSDIKQAEEAIQSLQVKIQDIAAKADRSEKMVQVICADIRQLDHAKRHLQTTITALKRLHMLVNAVGQLEEMAEKKQYKEAANLLDAVSQLTVHFESFQSVPKISELTKTVASVRSSLSSQIFAAFREIGEIAGSTADASTFSLSDGSEAAGGFKSLGEACLVVDALGPEARRRQVEEFATAQLKPYSKIFRPEEEHSGLDQVDRRFAWFRRLLKNIDERFENVFPAHWHLQYKLCLQFLQMTFEGVKLKLEDTDSPDSENVIVIVKALQKSLLFEREMTAKFEREYGSSVASTTVDKAATYDDGMEYDKDGNEVDPRSAEGIKLRYLRERAKSKAIAEKTGHGGGADDGDEHALLPLVGILSGVFFPFMGPYVSLERQNIASQIAGAVADDELDDRGESPVYASSINLFVYIKNSINRCCALTTGQVFFNLYKEYRDALTAYSKALMAKMPQPYVSSTAMLSNQLSGNAAPAAANPKTANYRVPAGEEVTVCNVINTCEYAVDTIEPLEELIKDKIDETYEETVDLMDSQDEFNDVTTVAIRILISGLESRLEPFFKELTSTNWSAFSEVGEESQYAQSICGVIEPYFTSCSKVLPNLYYRNVCDKFARGFVSAFMAAVSKGKRYSDVSTQQLLLDSYMMKSLLLSLPTLAGGVAPNMYVRDVTKDMGNIELLLKLVGTPVEMLVEVFRQQKPDGTLKDLSQIMTMKGMKRPQQTELLEAFGGKG